MESIHGYRFRVDEEGKQILQVQKCSYEDIHDWQHLEWFDASEDEAESFIVTMRSFVK